MDQESCTSRTIRVVDGKEKRKRMDHIRDWTLFCFTFCCHSLFLFLSVCRHYLSFLVCFLCNWHGHVPWIKRSFEGEYLARRHFVQGAIHLNMFNLEFVTVYEIHLDMFNLEFITVYEIHSNMFNLVSVTVCMSDSVKWTSLKVNTRQEESIRKERQLYWPQKWNWTQKGCI